jgi:hypothetical protein
MQDAIRRTTDVFSSHPRVYRARSDGISSLRNGVCGRPTIGGAIGVAAGIDSLHVFIGASAFGAWVVPAVILVLLLVAAWVGLRWVRSEHREVLRRIPLFSLLSERELNAVLGSAHAVDFEPGARIIEPGQGGKGFFVVTDGSATVTLDGTDLETLEPGSYFGEMAVIDGGPRTANITARTQVSTLQISPTAFLHLVDREPMVARGIYEELRRRLKASGTEVDEAPDGPIDRSQLAALCELLRERSADWVRTDPTGHRSLWLSKLFARGA